ncbi:hypothetical protein HYS28_02175 [Candidatus Uhrbacteria bacterium]|nr:hypothetical protein [Candidatus Uhrbacteria bacterium]
MIGEEVIALRKNLNWNLRQAVLQVSHAKKVNTRARSGYYKAAALFLCSIVEAVAFYLLRKKLNALPSDKVPLEPKECHEIYALPQSFSSPGIDLVVAKRYQKPFQLTQWTEFARVNEKCRQLGIISEPLFKRMEWARKLRNRYHLQGRHQTEQRWTMNDIERISKVLSALRAINDGSRH